MIKETIKRLKHGEPIALFPEGRSKTVELQEAKCGVGMISSSSRSPVVPTMITGANRVLPFGAKRLKRAKVLIIFGKPIYPLYPSTVNNFSEKDGKYEELPDRGMSSIGELQKRYGDNNS